MQGIHGIFGYCWCLQLESPFLLFSQRLRKGNADIAGSVRRVLFPISEFRSFFEQV
jgi:hypothetical protein